MRAGGLAFVEARRVEAAYTRISLVIDMDRVEPRLRLTDTRVAQYVLLAVAVQRSYSARRSTLLLLLLLHIRSTSALI